MKNIKFVLTRSNFNCKKMEKSNQNSRFKIGDEVLVSPYITHKKEWIKGVVIEIEENSFVGIIITVKTELGEIFEKEYLFKKMTENVCD